MLLYKSINLAKIIKFVSDQVAGVGSIGHRVITMEQFPVGSGSKMPAWLPPAVIPTISQ